MSTTLRIHGLKKYKNEIDTKNKERTKDRRAEKERDKKVCRGQVQRAEKDGKKETCSSAEMGRRKRLER